MKNAEKIVALPLVEANPANGYYIFDLGSILVGEKKTLLAEIELSDDQQEVAEITLSRTSFDPDYAPDQVGDAAKDAVILRLKEIGIEAERDDLIWGSSEDHTEDSIYLKFRIAKPGNEAKGEGEGENAAIGVAEAARRMLEWSAERRWGVARDRAEFEKVLKRAIKDAR